MRGRSRLREAHMPKVIKGNDTMAKQVRHGEHLTFVDQMRAALLPNAGHNEAGKPNFPKAEFLEQRAAERKQAADDEARRK